MAWLILFAAGVFEIVWAVALKQSDGFTKVLPTVVFGVTAALSFVLLSYALKTIPMGTAYAVWTGIGAVGIAIIGMGWFGEPVNLIRIACISMIILGIAGLKITGASGA